MSNYLTTFSHKIDQLIELSEANKEDAKEIKTSLFQAFQVDFINKLTKVTAQFDQKETEVFLKELENFKGLEFLDEPSFSMDDLEHRLEKIKDLIISKNFDFEKELESCANTVFAEFVESLV